MKLYSFTALEIAMSTRMRRLAPAGMLTALLLAASQPSWAADFGPVTGLQGCPDFTISVSGTGGNQVTRVIKTKNGFTRSVTGGDGFILTFKNESTGKSIQVPTNGSVTTATVAPDGSTTFKLTGQNVFIFFGTDTGGARTVLYTGNAVIANDPSGKSTFQSLSGKQQNLCPALAAP
ncbi:hypothetical protein [Arthrobacter sp. NPDC057013]|uniref:hypothetical protein n=1 Tax=Arthrobacter sp. NPDC057013 TaxID=3345999 RepID=UPI00363EC5B7